MDDIIAVGCILDHSLFEFFKHIPENILPVLCQPRTEYGIIACLFQFRELCLLRLQQIDCIVIRQIQLFQIPRHASQNNMYSCIVLIFQDSLYLIHLFRDVVASFS